MSLPGGTVLGTAPTSNAEQQAETERQAVEQQRQTAYGAAKQQFEAAKQAAQQQLQDANNAANQRYQQAVEEARKIGQGATPEEADAAAQQRDAAIEAAKQQLEQDKQAAKQAYDGAVQAAQQAQDSAIAEAEQTAQSALQSIDQKAAQQQQIEDQTAQQQEQLQEGINQPYVPGQQPTSPGQLSPTEGAIPAPTVAPPGGPTPSGIDADNNGIDDALELYNHAISQGRPGVIGTPNLPPRFQLPGGPGAPQPPPLPLPPVTPAPQAPQGPIDQSIEAVLQRAGITLPVREPGRDYTPQVSGQTPSFAQPPPPPATTPGREYTPQVSGQTPSWLRTPNLQDEGDKQRALIAEQMKIDPTWAPQLYGSPALTPQAVQEQRDIAGAVNAPRADEPAVPYQPAGLAPPPIAQAQAPTPITPGGAINRSDEWPGTTVYEDQAAGGWVAVPEQGKARFLSTGEAQQAVRGGATPVGPSAASLTATARSAALNGDPATPTDINTVAPRPGTTPQPAAGAMNRADEWPGSAVAAKPPAQPAAGAINRADEWPGATPPAPAQPAAGAINRADEWPGAPPPVPPGPSAPSAPPPGMTPTGLTQTNPDGSTSDIMWDPATRSTVAIPRAAQTGPVAGAINRADEWGQPPNRTPGLSRADEWTGTGDGTGNPNAIHTATPASYRNDAIMANPNYSFTRFVQPRNAEEQQRLGTVLDQSMQMYDAQKAGTSRIPLRDIPVEEKAIVADAVGALARGDESVQWAVTPLQNAARAAWQQENGDPGVDPKFADPNYVARWVNGFLEGKTDLPYQKELSDDIRRVGKPPPEDIAASRNGPSWIGKFGKDLGAGIKVDNEAKQLTVPQTAEMATRYGMGANNTYAVCGPIAANGMLRAANGDDSVPLDQVWQKALDGKYWNGAWTGPVNFTRFLRKEYNKDVSMVSEMSYSPGDLGDMNGQIKGGVRPSEIAQTMAQDVTSGKPVTVSISGSNGHYFVATDYDANANKFYVGTTGTVYKGGKEWMSLDEMKTKAGGGGIAAIRFNETLKGERKGEPFKVPVPGTVKNMDEIDRQSVATAPKAEAGGANVTPQDTQYNVWSYNGPIDVSSHASRNGTGPGEIADFITRKAEERGIDPSFALHLTDLEGGDSNPVKQNDGGSQAFGPLQMMRGGLGTEFERYMRNTYGVDADVRQPKWWKAATEFGLDTAARAKNWNPWQAATDRGIQFKGFNDPKPQGISDEALIYAGGKAATT
jgi:hypothetical protein